MFLGISLKSDFKRLLVAVSTSQNLNNPKKKN